MTTGSINTASLTIRTLLALLMGSSLWLASTTAYAISVEQLSARIAQGERLTLIDIRANALYQKSHMQNAINIPASLMARKKLPPLGQVIVYGDGIDTTVTQQAVAALKQKRGIQAESLDGGYTAWQAQHTTVQQSQGLDLSQTRQLNYQTLQRISQSNAPLLLVDLRQQTPREALSEHFPGQAVYTPQYRTDSSAQADHQAILSGLPKNNEQILIFIDDTNGLSEQISNKLNAAGVKRVAILVGGEQALRTRGHSSYETRTTGD